MNSREHCPVCEHTPVRRFLRRERIPVHQNEVIRSREAARTAGVGTLDLAVCERCGFIYNSAFEARKLRYGASYDNTQTCSPAFRKHVDGLARYLVEEHGVRNSSIVEVGCGNAYFLHKLVDNPAFGNKGTGFDPSYAGDDQAMGDRISIERRYFDADCQGIRADVVVSRHVIEHVPDPVGMLQAARIALEDSPDARVFFETPCVDWILEGQVFWDFFYEHCSYFTAASLTTAFERAGFSVSSVKHIFGGQYLWLEGRAAKVPPQPKYVAGPTPLLAAAFGAQERGRAESFRGRLLKGAFGHRLAVWGAGAKGATLVNLLDRDNTLFDCLIDINPNKQGCYIVGTGHPIVSPETADRRDIAAAFLMNPNYRGEVEAMIRAAGSSMKILDSAW